MKKKWKKWHLRTTWVFCLCGGPQPAVVFLESPFRKALVFRRFELHGLGPPDWHLRRFSGWPFSYFKVGTLKFRMLQTCHIQCLVLLLCRRNLFLACLNMSNVEENHGILREFHSILRDLRTNPTSRLISFPTFDSSTVFAEKDSQLPTQPEDCTLLARDHTLEFGKEKGTKAAKAGLWTCKIGGLSMICMFMLFMIITNNIICI